MAEPKALIITGYGLNCEDETEHVFQLAGAQPEKVHVSEIIAGDKKITDYQILAFIGGFCDGDHLGAGTVQASRFRHKLADDLAKFIDNGRLIIAICNGFQTAVKMGILPADDGDYRKKTATLTTNDSGIFEDRWVYLRVNTESPCIWTKSIERLYLPVRHGEGKFFTQDEFLLDRLFDKNLFVCQYADPDLKPTMEYPANPNGSLEAIAGICDPSGRIFGLMPHPEAYWSPYNHPSWTRLKIEGKMPEEGEGVQIFRNAVRYFE
jgi:phosphoribosylformylglycinamidine synthase